VFNWDFKDAFYNHRRELTTVVTLGPVFTLEELKRMPEEH